MKNYPLKLGDVKLENKWTHRFFRIGTIWTRIILKQQGNHISMNKAEPIWTIDKKYGFM